jgi:hypothetical protein
MLEQDRAKLRRAVVAAIYDVCGLGKPPSDDAAVESYLKTQIRVVLGINAGQADRVKVAKLIAAQTDITLRKEFGLAKNQHVAKFRWLTEHESEPVSTYADSVEAAMPT